MIWYDNEIFLNFFIKLHTYRTMSKFFYPCQPLYDYIAFKYLPLRIVSNFITKKKFRGLIIGFVPLYAFILNFEEC